MSKTATYFKPVGISYDLSAAEIASGQCSFYLKDQSTSGTVKPVIVAAAYTSADAIITLTNVEFAVTTGLCTVKSAGYATGCRVDVMAMFL